MKEEECAEARSLTPQECIDLAFQRYKGRLRGKMRGEATLAFPSLHHATSWAAALLIEGQCLLVVQRLGYLSLASPVTVIWQYEEA